MKKLAIFLLLAVSFCSAQESGEDILHKMYSRYKNGPCRYYTFSQRNEHYNNDTLVGKSVWHEAVGFPDKFRIIFGDSALGNEVLFCNDSVYRYRQHKLTRSDRDSNSLLLLLGGMYYREFADVKARLKAAGYDLSRIHSAVWNKKPVFVVGASSNDELSNQLWVDKADLRIVRIVEKMNATDTMDMRFDSHRKWCKGFVEDRVSFRRNGVLEQVEEYYNMRESAPW